MLYIWLAVIVALVLVEILSRNLTAACFMISAIISAICTLFTDEYTFEVCSFLVIGILLLIFVRPNILVLLKNYEKKEKEEKKETKKEDKKEEKVEVKKQVKKTPQKNSKKSVKKKAK